jgi:hypothetical protein
VEESHQEAMIPSLGTSRFFTLFCAMAVAGVLTSNREAMGDVPPPTSYAHLAVALRALAMGLPALRGPDGSYFRAAVESAVREYEDSSGQLACKSRWIVPAAHATACRI